MSYQIEHVRVKMAKVELTEWGVLISSWIHEHKEREAAKLYNIQLCSIAIASNTLATQNYTHLVIIILVATSLPWSRDNAIS